MEITRDFAASTKEWTKTDKLIILARGQPSTKLERLVDLPFFSTSVSMISANKFLVGEKCCLLLIKVKKGVPYLVVNNMSEYEVLLAGGGKFSSPVKKDIEYMNSFTEFKDDWDFFEGEDIDLYEVTYSFDS